jgi:hypothetical protein
MIFSPAHDLPQQSLSSGNSLAPDMMESESPPRASPPHATDNTEVLSQRTSPGQGEVRKAAETAPEGNASAAGNMGGVIPMETDGGGPNQSGPQPNTAPETHTAPGLSEQPPSKEGGVPTPPASSINPEAPDTLREALRRASVADEHRALMGTVVEKVQSAKSGLNEAFTSLLTGFEVCDVISVVAFHI